MYIAGVEQTSRKSDNLQVNKSVLDREAEKIDYKRKELCSSPLVSDSLGEFTQGVLQICIGVK